ncbi:MAG: multidrug effflux MFS transporter [Turneriella sp.]|nr:multidrug effflux MFS transporter [Turneriella sp.]
MQAHPRARLIIWILGALATLSPLAIDLYLPAFPELARDFKTTQAQLALSVTGYFIGMALGQILYGPFLDRFGRKPSLYAGLFLFILSSLGCIFAPGLDILIVLRFFQALGGSVAWVAAVAMVRDFFPVSESARVFSLLVLILGVSPLLGPTVGGFIAAAWGWRSVFFALTAIAVFILFLLRFYLPEGQKADVSVSLRLGPIFRTFSQILKEPAFYTYAFSSAFSFATLFIYVAASPTVFMEFYGLSPKSYSLAFALLSIGFISSSQLNVLLSQRVKSAAIFRIALFAQITASAIFFCVALMGWLNLYATFALLFICLASIGFNNPNATALALAPFTRNMGSASALLGFIQIGVAGFFSAGIGLFTTKGVTAMAGLIALTAVLAGAVLLMGRSRIGVMPERQPGAAPAGH